MSKSSKQTVTSKTSVPQYIEDQSRSLIDRSNEIANTPYQPYTGDRMANFTPEQEAAWAQTIADRDYAQGLLDNSISTAERLTGFTPGAVNSQNVTGASMGSAAANAASARIAQISPAEAARAAAAAASSGYATASAGERAAAASASGAQAKYEQTRANQIGEFMNPFTQDVIDRTMNTLGRENTILQNGNNAAAAAAGAFGGSRHGVLGAETNRGYLDTVANTTAGLNQSNYAQALAAAQQNTGLRQQTTLTNADRATQASIASAANAQSANNLNAQLSQGLNLYNAGNQQQSLLSNAGFQQQANLANAGNSLQVALANAGFRQQGAQFNASNQQQANLFNAGNQQQSLLQNAGWQQQANIGNADRALQAGTTNQQAAIQAAGVQQNAATQNAAYAGQRASMDATQNAQLEAIGQQRQQQQQAILDQQYEEFLRQQQYPIDMLNLQNATLAGQPYGQTNTTTQPITSNSGAAIMGGGLAGLQAAGALGLGTGASAGMGLAGAALGFLSDRRMKTDIKRLGKDEASGLPMYAYRYKGDPKSYPKIVGPMAQDVEKRYPGATERVNGKLVIKVNSLAGRMAA